VVRHPLDLDDPGHAADVRRSAEHLAGLMEAAGLHTEILTVDGSQPAVYAEWLGAGPDAPTVTVYGHHDVQPVDPLDQWTTPPFEPTVRVGRLHARGASDDKGQVHFQVSAIRHLLAADGRLPVNLGFLVEGEEENGSPNIGAFLRGHAERLACDVIVVSDTGMVAEDVPSLVTGMRGLVYVQVDLRTAAEDLHSGVFGGTVPNAVEELVALLGGLKDDRGRIAIPGWYDDVRDLDAEERANLAALALDPRDIGVGALPGEEGWSPVERVAGRPAADVNGVWGGHTGVGSKSVIPAEAHAKVSFRLVADQDPARLEPLFNREGGSGPERALSDALGADCVFLGVMLPSDRIHAPDERLLLANYFRGVRAAAYTFEELARPEVVAALRAWRG
jgi:acetylornithine deacetylase/succinyl-diaminopimelate desuccinylase-like protein